MGMEVFDWMETESFTARESNIRPTILAYRFRSSKEVTHRVLRSILPIKEHWNAAKIIFSMGWEDLGVKDTIMRQRKGRIIGEPINEYLEILEEMEVPVLDRYYTSLEDFLEKI
jgi:hypothetical protein